MTDAPARDGAPAQPATPGLIRAIGGFAALVMAWPAMLARPTTGSDMSWVLAIAEARARGVRWGQDLVFPYGPLGFLATGSATRGCQFALAVGYRVGLIGLLFAAAADIARRSPRRTLGAPMLIGLAVLIGATNAPAELLIAAAFARLFAARDRVREAVAAGDDPVVHAVLWRAQAEASVLAALGLVTKFSVGVVLVVLAGAHLLAVVLTARRALSGRDTARLLAGGPVLGVVAVVGMWLAADQRLGDLPTYLRRSWELSAGYVQSMWLDNRSDRFGFIVALLAALVVVGVVRRWRSALARADALAWWFELIVLVPVLVVVLRASFTRMDSGHTFVFTGIAGLLCVPYLAASQRRTEWPVEALVLGVAAVVAVGQMGQSVAVVLDPAARVREVLGTADLLLRPGARMELLRDASASFPESADVTALLATLPSNAAERPSVAVLPLETSMIWRFRLAWSQPPVLQRYSSYTPALDGLDAAFLASANAPAYVLYQSGRSIDGRFVAAEAPRSLLALTCRYRPVDARGTWTLLRRLERSRCGTPTVLRTVTLRNGRPTDLVLPEAPDGSTRIYALTLSEPRRSLLERLRTAVLRPSGEDTITGQDGRRRLIASSFGAPIPLSGPDGPGDALVSGIVGDLAPLPATLSIAGPGWTTLHATISAYPVLDTADRTG